MPERDARSGIREEGGEEWKGEGWGGIRKGREGELVLERIIWMRNTTPRAPTHTSMQVPCAQQLCLIRRIVLAATGSLYTPPPLLLCKHTGIQARGRPAYATSLRMRATTWSLLSLSLLLFHAFLPFFLFLLLFFLLAQATTRFKRAENRIIMRAGQWESSGKLPYANLAVCAEAVTISMKGETASERNSRPSLPSHDKIRYEILSSHGIEGKIIVDRISIINRFIAIPRKFSFFFRAAIKITRICGTSHD